MPSASLCACGQVRLKDGDPSSQRPWRTTNQVFSECALEAGTLGLANQGICADLAVRMHDKQWR